MAARDLCTRADVTSYAPGYISNATTDALIDRLITAISDEIHRNAGREFKAISPADSVRRFEIGPEHRRSRIVRIGDLSTDPTAVKIVDYDQSTVVQTVTAANYVPLPRDREEWQSYTAIHLPPRSPLAVSLATGHLLEVTGTWGFPSVPDDIREACAGIVLFRYVSDAAAAGTLLAESLEEVNVGVLYAAARGVIDGYAPPLIA